VTALCGAGRPDIWQQVLAEYDVGPANQVRTGGGTAAPKVVVTTTSGRYLLRRRRPEMSDDAIVAFDHAVIAAVADVGLPVARPLPTRHGRTWVQQDGCAYELFPFIEGLQRFTYGNRVQIGAAARTLARFHGATASLQVPPQKRWPREHLISTMAETLAGALAGRGANERYLAEALTLLSSARRLEAELSTGVVAALPHTVTHGDFTPANVQFRGDAVGGVFDFDWVSHQPRLQDIGEALQFFSFPRRHDLDPDSIWSLVEAWQPDLGAASVFLAAYQGETPLTAAEAKALPLFMRETWLGVRIRAMRKVVPEEQLRILAEGAIEPLHWLESSADVIRTIALDTRCRQP